MAVTAALIKELREITGVGMSDCKKALVETDGDVQKAVEFLREKGLAAAAKKAGRVAAEGLVSTLIENNIGVVVEVNSETDFVAKNAAFVDYVNEVAVQCSKTCSTSTEELLTEKWYLDETLSVQDALSSKIAVIGENLSIRRFAKMEQEENTVLVSYIHGAGKVAVLLKLATEVSAEKVEEAGKNICMQIAAMNPKFVSRNEVSDEFIENEREILKQQALNEGKPADIVDKMIVGRLNKLLKEFCLIDQEYVKDGDFTVASYLEAISKEVGASVTIKEFVRFETGEGIEKKEENFAEEVAKTMQG